ncbi:MAG: hypothetical protein F6J98_33855 [Moorea sp. SIO4G2]|nr:hypothetical protein [Moorena sp. SIO4G2]
MTCPPLSPHLPHFSYFHPYSLFRRSKVRLFAIDLWSRYAMKRSQSVAERPQLPRLCDRTLNFLTIPILTQSLIVETTALDFTPTLSTLTTL